MTSAEKVNIMLIENNITANAEKDKYTADEQLKLKLRDINLIKYNPSLFTNKGNLHYILGGNNCIAFSFAFGLAALLYRRNLNSLRHVSKTEGRWLNFFYFAFGTTLGFGYNYLFFMRHQVYYNDSYANALMKRFKKSSQLNRRNIYLLKDVPNTDEEYIFTNTYLNTYHL